MSAEVIHGDCIDVLPTLAPQSVDAVVTSPPYAMQRAKQYGGVPEKDYPEWTVAWMRCVRVSLKERGSVLINIREHIRNGEMSDYVHRTRMALRADGWIECDELIWDKKSGFPCGAPSHPRRSWERILWFSTSRRRVGFPKANGTSPTGKICKTISRVQGGAMGASSGALSRGEIVDIARCTDVARFHQRTIPNGIAHPAAYPQPLAAWMIRLVTPPGGLVLDPFAGSGTTLVAALAEGRRAIGIEREAQYVEIARQRISAASTTPHNRPQLGG